MKKPLIISAILIYAMTIRPIGINLPFSASIWRILLWRTGVSQHGLTPSKWLYNIGCYLLYFFTPFLLVLATLSFFQRRHQEAGQRREVFAPRLILLRISSRGGLQSRRVHSRILDILSYPVDLPVIGRISRKDRFQDIREEDGCGDLFCRHARPLNRKSPVYRRIEENCMGLSIRVILCRPGNICVNLLRQEARRAAEPYYRGMPGFLHYIFRLSVGMGEDVLAYP